MEPVDSPTSNQAKVTAHLPSNKSQSQAQTVDSFLAIYPLSAVVVLNYYGVPVVVSLIVPSTNARLGDVTLLRRDVESQSEIRGIYDMISDS